MGAGAKPLLAVCEGGSDPAAIAVALLVAVGWVLAVRAIVGRETELPERGFLTALLIGSIALAWAIFLTPHGLDGDRDLLRRFLLSLLAPAAIALGIALASRRLSPARALGVSIGGALLVPAGVFVAFFTSLVIGTGCLA